MKRIVFLLVFISVAPGCFLFAFPLPAEHGQEIDKLQSQIVVGKTTMGDVISILGEPDVTEDRSISYFNKEYNGGWYVVYASGANVVGQGFMDFYFEFDNYGVLTDCGTNKYKSGRLGNSSFNAKHIGEYGAIAQAKKSPCLCRYFIFPVH